jgi:hypothetical protein
MKIQKFFLCAAIASTAFGASLGLLEIGDRLHEALAPVKLEIKPIEPIASPVVYPPQNFSGFELPAAESIDTDEPETQPEHLGENGYYYIPGEKPPEGFEEFEHFELTTYEWDEQAEKEREVEPTGTLRMKKDFDFSWLNRTGRRISFITRERGGISYQFDGKFIDAEKIKVKSEYGDYATDIVLKGRMTKWSKGKKIAEAKMKLAYTLGC